MTAPGRCTPRGHGAAPGWWRARQPQGIRRAARRRVEHRPRAGVRSCPARPAASVPAAGRPAVWPRLGAAPESNPSASDTASATSSDSPTAARSTNQTPSGYAGRALRAASNASLVFPLPPAPVRVSSRARPISRSTSTSSRSRPIRAGQRGGQIAGLPRLRRSLRRAGGRSSRRRPGQQLAEQRPPSGGPGRSRTRRAGRRPAAHSGPAPRIAGPWSASTTIRARTAPSCSGSDSSARVRMTSASSGARSPHARRQPHQDLAMGFRERRLVAPSANRHPAGRAADRRVYRSAAARRLASSAVFNASAADASNSSTSTSTGPAASSTTCSSRIASSPSLAAPGRRACGEPRTGSDAGFARRPPAPDRATGGPVPARDGGAARAPTRASPPGLWPYAAATARHRRRCRRPAR